MMLSLIIFFALFNVDDTIEWNENIKLKFEDFRGVKPENSEFDAKTYYMITYDFDRFYLKTKCIFLKESSFLDGNSELLLLHEQLHFDNGGLRARIIENEIKYLVFENNIEITVFNESNYFEKYHAKTKKFETLYDSTTKHGTIRDKQLIWVDIIEEAKKEKYLNIEEYENIINNHLKESTF
ncbi:hypothetical protein MY04_3055 [Flammeovirga sp. MY04]|uniref:hypothetical protein n=1 Tax=Flammeovirga sp. MY04 TaxID=1191459 RepID=UPI0008061A6C|nr:hypothetical protein [Flammeovirga sp. MY04]ANQ50423.1 hypothetical protein MY04_3055 [Flammeovirga sp. MY04]